jgi:YidC/Oxa1 family membrane protein insertase
MNHVLRNASRACLSKTSRARGPAAGTLNLNGPSRVLPSGTYMAQRFNSSGVDKSFDAPVISSDLSTQATQFPVDTGAIGDALTDAAVSVAIATPDAPGFATGHIMAAIDYLHTFADIPYWGAIAAFTVGVRLLMLPIAINTIRGSARMAAMRPEMQKVQDQFTSNPNQADAAVRERYQAEMKSLFVKHKCNPMRALLWPIAQFPIFMGFFLALKEMGLHYPGFATGGAYWFTDLSAADPTMILPIFNALSFLAMIELGSDGVQMQNQSTFKMVMRGLAVAMVPLTMDFSTVSTQLCDCCTNGIVAFQ